MLSYPAARVQHQESRPAPLSTMLWGALEELPSALGARAELWARRGCWRMALGGSRRRAPEALAQKCFWTSYPFRPLIFR
jgi:hypothetical protein